MPQRPTLTLVCNSHIDPVWLWPWEEGLAATLATFRSAAAFCEAFDDFVFCHNEALLYALGRGARAAALPPHPGPRPARAAGTSWAAGTSSPTATCRAANRSFGRRWSASATSSRSSASSRAWRSTSTRSATRAAWCRSSRSPATTATCSAGRTLAGWPCPPTISSGSATTAPRSSRTGRPTTTTRNSERPRDKVERWLEAHGAAPRGLLLWGVGNHGGGPSRRDLEAIAALRSEPTRADIAHGTPEALLRPGSRRRTAAALRARPEPVGARVLHVDGHRQAGPRAAGTRALRHRGDAGERWRCRAAAPTRRPRPAFVPRGPALLPVPRHPAWRRRARGRATGARPARPRPGDHRAAPRPGVLRAARRTAARGRRRVPDLRLQPPPVPGHAAWSSASSSRPNRISIRASSGSRADRRGGAVDVPLQLEKESCNIQNDQRKRARLRGGPARLVRGPILLPAAGRPTGAARRPLRRDIVPRDRMSPIRDVEISPRLRPAHPLRPGRRVAPARRPRLSAARARKDTADPWGMKTPRVPRRGGRVPADVPGGDGRVRRGRVRRHCRRSGSSNTARSGPSSRRCSRAGVPRRSSDTESRPRLAGSATAGRGVRAGGLVRARPVPEARPANRPLGRRRIAQTAYGVERVHRARRGSVRPPLDGDALTRRPPCADAGQRLHVRVRCRRRRTARLAASRPGLRRSPGGRGDANRAPGSLRAEGRPGRAHVPVLAQGRSNGTPARGDRPRVCGAHRRAAGPLRVPGRRRRRRCFPASRSADDVVRLERAEDERGRGPADRAALRTDGPGPRDTRVQVPALGLDHPRGTGRVRTAHARHRRRDARGLPRPICSSDPR